VSDTALDQDPAEDEAAFAELLARHRRELHLHCYRMLGSVTDADDLVQETIIAAWRGRSDFTGRSSLRVWLYRIATNRCLNAIRDAKRRPPSAPVPPFEPPEPSGWGEMTWLQPYPDAWLSRMPGWPSGPAEQYEAREIIELAFIAALQRLPPRQTAAVVLCDALDYSQGEAAAILGTTAVRVKGLLQRARASLDQNPSLAQRRRTGEPPAPAVASATDRELARRFARAFSADDISGVIALLTDDAWLSMPPAPHEYYGQAAIAEFLQASVDARAGRRFTLQPAHYNGQAAFGCVLGPSGHGDRVDAGILVLAIHENRIQGITRFLDPALPVRFQLDAV
jgi:RNA polymerase sigma-70 factor (TIGR02960 family)